MPMKIPYSLDEIASWKVSSNDILDVMEMFGVLDRSKLPLKNVQPSKLNYIEGNKPIKSNVHYEIDVSESYFKDAGMDYEYKSTVGNPVYQPNSKISEAA